MGHAIGDWDNDSHLDWFSTAIFHNQTDCSITGCVFGSGGNRLYRNHGNQKFDDATDKVLSLAKTGLRCRIMISRHRES